MDLSTENIRLLISRAKEGLNTMPTDWTRAGHSEIERISERIDALTKTVDTLKETLETILKNNYRRCNPQDPTVEIAPLTYRYVVPNDNP